MARLRPSALVVSVLRRAALGASLLAALPSCGRNPPTGQLGSHRAFAELRDVTGKTVGALDLLERGDALEIRAELHDLPREPLALALAPRGECEVRFQPAPFASAGEPVALAGPALTLAEGGGEARLRVPGLRLSDGDAPLLDWDGSALLLRRGDGAPVACGVVRR